MEEYVIEALETYHPHLYHYMIDIKPIGLDEYRIKMPDGRRIIFGYTDDEEYWLPQPVSEHTAYGLELIRRLKRMLVFSHLSLKDAAKLINVPYNTFTGYMAGKHKMPIRTVVTLVKACNISLDQMLDLDYLFD